MIVRDSYRYQRSNACTVRYYLFLDCGKTHRENGDIFSLVEHSEYIDYCLRNGLIYTSHPRHDFPGCKVRVDRSLESLMAKERRRKPSPAGANHTDLKTMTSRKRRRIPPCLYRSFHNMNVGISRGLRLM